MVIFKMVLSLLLVSLTQNLLVTAQSERKLNIKFSSFNQYLFVCLACYEQGLQARKLKQDRVRLARTAFQLDDCKELCSRERRYSTQIKIVLIKFKTSYKSCCRLTVVDN